MKNQLLEKRAVTIPTLMIMIIMFAFTEASAFSQGKPEVKNKPKHACESLTIEQKAQIKTILSDYDATTLSPEQACEINEKFRQADIHPGPETREAIIAAGFDPEKLKSNAPMHGREKEAGAMHLSPEQRMKMVDEKVLKPLALNDGQTVTVTAAFKVFFEGMENVMKLKSDKQTPPDRSNIEALAQTRDDKIKQVLTTEQFNRYQELERSARPPRPE